jgi:hypothetical protein
MRQPTPPSITTANRTDAALDRINSSKFSAGHRNFALAG